MSDPQAAQPSCGTCRHWKPLHCHGYGVCVLIGSGQAADDASIEGGCQGVSEPLELETKETFFCSLWEAKP